MDAFLHSIAINTSLRDNLNYAYGSYLLSLKKTYLEALLYETGLGIKSKDKHGNEVVLKSKDFQTWLDKRKKAMVQEEMKSLYEVKSLFFNICILFL